MRIDRGVAVLRERRWVVVTGAVLALVLTGSIVALAGNDGAAPHQASVLREASGTKGVARPDGAVTTQDFAASTAAGAATAQAPAAQVTGDAVAPASGVAPAPSLAPDDKAGAKIVKTATLRVEVGKGRFQGAFDRAASIAAGHGGYVASSSESTVDEKASEGTITVRVPADQFDNARRDLGALGKVQHQELSGQDVTAQIVDYDARIHSLQGQEEALSTLLSRARSVGEVLEVQGQLFNVRQQIEQLQAQRANIGAQADLSTITLTVYEPGAAATKPAPEPATGLARSWSRAWDGAVAVVGGTVIVIGYLVPLVLIGLLGWGVWRLASRRRRPAAAATPAS